MKKKFLFGLFGLTLLLFNLTQNINIEQNNKFDFSRLTNIANANPEEDDDEGGMANVCCPIWTVTVETGWPWPKVTCTTGGSYKCENCTCPS